MPRCYYTMRYMCICNCTWHYGLWICDVVFASPTVCCIWENVNFTNRECVIRHFYLPIRIMLATHYFYPSIIPFVNISPLQNFLCIRYPMLKLRLQVVRWFTYAICRYVVKFYISLLPFCWFDFAFMHAKPSH